MVLGLAEAGAAVVATAARERGELDRIASDRIHAIVADVTRVTVNALLPGGPTLTGMVPASFLENRRASLLDPAIMVPPLKWIAGTKSDGVTGRRFIATEWRDDNPEGSEVWPSTR
jgi:NAD(P)-dependent dehydrogenase (short-subunit alcohol dehydrogenase family)